MPLVYTRPKATWAALAGACPEDQEERLVSAWVTHLEFCIHFGAPWRGPRAALWGESSRGPPRLSGLEAHDLRGEAEGAGLVQP